jgi:hypothetical protein
MILAALAVAVSFAASNACHWIITQTYFRVSFETRLLLDKKTYTDGAKQKEVATKMRCRLTYANIIAGLIIVAISACYYYYCRKYDISLISTPCDRLGYLLLA